SQVEAATSSVLARSPSGRSTGVTSNPARARLRDTASPWRDRMDGSVTRATLRPTLRRASSAPASPRMPAPTRMRYERGPRRTGMSIMGFAAGRLPALQVVEVALVVSPDLLDAVARELFEEGFGEHQRHHGLPHHARGGHRAHVAAFDHGLHRLLGRHVDRAQRLAQGRDRLHGGTDDDRLAVRHAALETARAVGAAVEAAGLVEEDLVVDLG